MVNMFLKPNNIKITFISTYVNSITVITVNLVYHTSTFIIFPETFIIDQLSTQRHCFIISGVIPTDLSYFPMFKLNLPEN